MVEIYDNETLAAFRASKPDSALVALVERLVGRARVHGLWEDLTCIVVEPEGDLLGAEPVEWDWRVEHGDWIELGKTAGNSGFAWIAIVPFEPLA
ncbi:hypothetical protein [Novosphingobium sp. BL-52-GroH]|uniref:hypothetical protein n=1 Tax=Novosphingobium sp. BL-52-GroH TaxID=3349877 RepID=UPI00384C735B